MQPATVTPRPSNHLLSQWPLFHQEKALSSPWSCQSHMCCWSFKYLFLFLELMLVGLQLGDGGMCMCVFLYVCESLGALRKTPKAWIYPHSVPCSLELKQTWFDCCLQTPGYSLAPEHVNGGFALWQVPKSHNSGAMVWGLHRSVSATPLLQRLQWVINSAGF